jgi:hypothetical protein
MSGRRSDTIPPIFTIHWRLNSRRGKNDVPLLPIAACMRLAVGNCGCTALNTGNPWIYHGFARAQNNSEKPSACCAVAGMTGGLAALWVWLGLKSSDGLEVGNVGGADVRIKD